MANRRRSGWGRNKFGVKLNTSAVNDLASALELSGLTKKEARHRALVEVYAKRSCDDMLFASEKECRRYQELKNLQALGIITDLKLQVKFPLHVNGVSIANYIADFTYYDSQSRYTVEDSKGRRTDVYKRSKKHMKAEYDIDILET